MGMYLLVMGWRNECYLGQSNRHELKKACVPLSRKKYLWIYKPYKCKCSITGTSGMHSDELIDYSGKTSHECHISIGKVTTKAASLYLQTSWWICNTGSITWNEMLYPMSINKEIHFSSFVMTACKVEVELFKKASHHKHVWKHAAGLEECLTPCRLFAIALEPLQHPCWITHYSFQDFAANKRNPKQFSSPLTFMRQMISEAHASGFQNIDVPYAQNFVLILTANADH